MLPRLTPLCMSFCLTAQVALAQGVPTPPAEPGFTTGLWTRGNLLGDLGGLRTALGNVGITIGLQDINEVWGNVSGGIQRGADYDGVTLMSVGLDTQRAFGWEGGTINVSAWNIRGRSLSTDNLLNLQTVSGILAAPTTRLWEVWYQQSFLDGRFDVKLGQQSLDQEFINSQYSGLFINTMMGWPMVPSADLYAGGPAYPLSSLGVRLRGQLGGGFTALGGVFQDNPPGGPFDADSQLLGSTRWGGNFNLRTGALFIAELQYALNQPGNGDMDYGNHTTRPAWHLQARCVGRYCAVPIAAVRQHRPVAGRSEHHRRAADAAQQLQYLRRDGPDGVASLGRQPALRRCVCPPDGRARRPQPDQLQRQRGRRVKGAVARS